jgi:hypothetical protein
MANLYFQEEWPLNHVIPFPSFESRAIDCWYCQQP